MTDPRMIRCSACGAMNRVPREKLAAGMAPVCGRCKKLLVEIDTPVNKVVIVTDDTFAHEVERSPLPVLVDMWAPWCGPCRTIAPMIEVLATELAGRVRVAKLNVDDNPDTAARYQIQSIPALLVMKAGREVDRMVGVMPKAEIRRRLERAIG